MTDDEKAWGQAFVAKAIGGKPVKGAIVVHLGAAGSGKRWPGENARKIISLATQRGYHCFLFDDCEITPTGGVYPDGVTLIKNPNNSETLSIISACDVVLCVDNFIFKSGKSAKKVAIPLFGFVPDYYATVCDRRNLLLRSPNSYSPDPNALMDEVEREIEDLASEHVLPYDLGEINTFEI
jgi:ADP-heptose:LPS heptosyltransferase